MPEFLTEQSLAVLFPAIAALALWRENLEQRKQIRSSLMEGITMGKERVAEITSMSAVLSSIQRTIKKMEAQHNVEFANLKRQHSAIYERLKN